jgi:hypothetical protein
MPPGRKHFRRSRDAPIRKGLETSPLPIHAQNRRANGTRIVKELGSTLAELRIPSNYLMIYGMGRIQSAGQHAAAAPMGLMTGIVPSSTSTG